MQKIGIFCSASERIDARYAAAAREVGEWLGRNGKTLVYGGCDLGLMEAVAQAAKAAGATIVGVVPDIMETWGHTSRCIDRVVPCHGLSERKDIMTREADILVALPGGVGTLDEIFSVMSANSIGYHQKRVVLYNTGGFWDDLLHTLHALDAQGFVNTPLPTMMAVANSMDELTQIINTPCK